MAWPQSCSQVQVLCQAPVGFSDVSGRSLTAQFRIDPISACRGNSVPPVWVASRSARTETSAGQFVLTCQFPREDLGIPPNWMSFDLRLYAYVRREEGRIQLNPIEPENQIPRPASMRGIRGRSGRTFSDSKGSEFCFQRIVDSIPQQGYSFRMFK